MKLVCICSPHTNTLLLLLQSNRGMLHHQARQNIQPRTCEHFDVDFFLVPDSLVDRNYLLAFGILDLGRSFFFKSSADSGDMSLFAAVVALGRFKTTLVSLVVLSSTVLAREMVSRTWCIGYHRIHVGSGHSLLLFPCHSLFPQLQQKWSVLSQ